MSDVRIFAVQNKLAEVVRTPGGQLVSDAVKTAEARVEAQRPVTLASLVEKAELLAAVAAEGRGSSDPAVFGRIYDIANAMFGLAGAFGLTPLAQASLSLCDLSDGFRCGDAPSWPAIDVHVDGIRLLATLGEKAGAAGAESILDGLRRVRARVLPST